jgi:hypothetical protein
MAKQAGRVMAASEDTCDRSSVPSAPDTQGVVWRISDVNHRDCDRRLGRAALALRMDVDDFIAEHPDGTEVRRHLYITPRTMACPSTTPLSGPYRNGTCNGALF